MTESLYNVPSTDTTVIDLGQCIVKGDLYRTPTAAGVTPEKDFGVVEEVSLEITRQLLSCYQGTPKRLIAQHCIQEDGVLKVKGWQWDIDAMKYALGAGTTTIVGTAEQFDFGGLMSLAQLQLMLQHTTPTGATLYIDMWKACGNGSLIYSFNPSDYNKFDYTFNLWHGESDWVGGTLTAGQNIYRYRRDNYPS